MRKAPALLVLALLVLAVLPTPLAHAEEPIDWQAVNRIRNEGFHASRVMATARELTEVIGSRLTGSPGMRRANEWTRDRLAEWGLADARLEPWGPFGRGWSFDRVAVHLVEPFPTPLVALPLAWTPGTEGPVRGELVRVTLEDEEDFEEHRGKLAGKVLLLDAARELRAWGEPVVHRHDPEALEELREFEIPAAEGEPWRDRARKRWRFRRALNRFLVEEGAVATIEVSSRDAGLVRAGGGGSREPGESPGVPGLVMAVDPYNRLVRLAGATAPPGEEGEDEKGLKQPSSDSAGAGGGSDSAGAGGGPAPAPVVEIDVVARYHDDDPMAYNTVADLPGTDLARELVMVGAHLDSWHGGTGATDNAAGSAIVMEAVRILAALGIEPRRTIRIALWSGEEQGLLGSRAYVAEHFASRPASEDPEELDLPESLREARGPLDLKGAHQGFSAYFNVDNGGGRIRGIYTQENAAVVPIFEAWLEPFHDLGAKTVTLNNTGGTDHLPFDRVGLPGFQFIQDMRDYETLTHHTNADGFDHLSREDMIQASVVLASFLYHAAMRDEPLPRKPLP
ncbi:MAG TPA: M20/M25/M40 family metallo-hydrolase, partial [Thermoanaerobaculia bacterium]|nr:M20/M25/M40 family metallo-hydrolase [Thermoanaerobaculia bacterium]